MDEEIIITVEDTQEEVSLFIHESETLTGGGDMKKSTYDVNGNGTVDDAEKVNGKTVEENVPPGALFTDTDTVYDDTAIQAEVDSNTAKVGVTTEEENTIDSITAGEPAGSDQVVNVVSLLQAEYDAGVIALTINATTIYNITDA